MNIPNPSLNLLGKKIVFSAVVQYLGKAFQFAFAALTMKYISNFLSENEFGVYATITEYALFFSVVANLGIFAYIVRKMATNPTDGRVFVQSLFLRVVSAVGIFSCGFLFLLLTGNSALFILATVLFFGTLLFDFMTSVCDGMLQANYLMGRATLASVVGKIFSLFGIIFLVHWSENFGIGGSQGVILIFLPLLIGSIITFGLSFFFVSQKIRLQWKISSQEVWKIFRDGLPFGIITIINSLYFRFLPDYFSHEALTKSQFATFNISFRIAQVMSLFSTFLMFSALPGIREYIAEKHWQKIRRLYSKILWVLTAGGAALVIFGSILGPTLLTLLTHKKYFLPEFWYVFPLMLLLAAISYYYDLVLITLFAFDQSRWLLSRELLALGVALLFSFSSLFFVGVHLKLLMILFGAIAGESVMVICGLIKTRRLIRASLHTDESGVKSKCSS